MPCNVNVKSSTKAKNVVSPLESIQNVLIMFLITTWTETKFLSTQVHSYIFSLPVTFLRVKSFAI